MDTRERQVPEAIQRTQRAVIPTPTRAMTPVTVPELAIRVAGTAVAVRPVRQQPDTRVASTTPRRRTQVRTLADTIQGLQRAALAPAALAPAVLARAVLARAVLVIPGVSQLTPTTVRVLGPAIPLRHLDTTQRLAIPTRLLPTVGVPPRHPHHRNRAPAQTTAPTTAPTTRAGPLAVTALNPPRRTPQPPHPTHQAPRAEPQARRSTRAPRAQVDIRLLTTHRLATEHQLAEHQLATERVPRLAVLTRLAKEAEPRPTVVPRTTERTASNPKKKHLI